MKTKSKLSLFSVVLVLVVIALVLYYFLYFTPAQTERTQLKAEIALNNAQAALCGAYLNDHTPLEEGIATAEAEIADLRANAFTNETSVNMVISNAIQKHAIDLTGLTVDPVTTIGEHNALPIHLNVSGKLTNVLDFLTFFETDTAGSYLVNGVSMETANGNCTATVTMYLCTPAV